MCLVPTLCGLLDFELSATKLVALQVQWVVHEAVSGCELGFL